MGCDIHMILEKRVADGKGVRWVGVNSFSGHHRAHVKEGEYDWSSPVARTRNYDRFAALAGVRGEGPEPKGLPSDASDLTMLLADEWGEDGHSHSFLSLAEAVEIFKATEWPGSAAPDPASLGRKFPASYFFEVESGDVSDYRLVFWFDN